VETGEGLYSPRREENLRLKRGNFIISPQGKRKVSDQKIVDLLAHFRSAKHSIEAAKNEGAKFGSNRGHIHLRRRRGE